MIAVIQNPKAWVDYTLPEQQQNHQEILRLEEAEIFKMCECAVFKAIMLFFNLFMISGTEVCS